MRLSMGQSFTGETDRTRVFSVPPPLGEARKNATDAERIHWGKLRNKQLGGFKFRRQQPIGQYIVDFVNFERKVVVELDGGHHKAQRGKDEARDLWLRRHGYEVIRFWDNEVFENLEGVLETIREKLLANTPEEREI